MEDLEILETKTSSKLDSLISKISIFKNYKKLLPLKEVIIKLLLVEELIQKEMKTPILLEPETLEPEETKKFPLQED
ncbi:MAG: hypothetical protein EB127_29905 [Alphaproteobacteria bacterium]|nr:hypothetical protein [Alphaproteobacteria bacterium]